MRFFFIAFTVGLLASISFCEITSRLNIKTEDGTVNTYPYQARFTNGTITDNNDGTISITSGSGLSAGSTNYIQNTLTPTTTTQTFNVKTGVFSQTGFTMNDGANQWTVTISTNGALVTAKVSSSGGTPMGILMGITYP